MITDYLRRGLAAGLLAGLLSGLFAWAAGEPTLRAAIEIEEQSDEGHSHGSEESGGGHDHEDELVSRPVQEAMLPVATSLVGAAFGGVFGLAFGLARSRLTTRDEWAATWKVGAAVTATVVLYPALVYPANPPGVGDPGTVGNRTALYFATLAIGAVTLGFLWWLAKRLHAREWEPPQRQITVAAAGVAVLGTAWLLLPSPAGGADFPADVFWSFRLSSIGTQLLLWVALTTIFAWLSQRAQTKTAKADAL
ncbi:CbtA family protein [Haloglycomyces albus]|uniref:CbtA family protein n=1 Tax=Haloglycomyces albus TaxID=526067 RepID=UPI00046D42B4|nr:CbtA family protein [Haloglycomyces albus]